LIKIDCQIAGRFSILLFINEVLEIIFLTIADFSSDFKLEIHQLLENKIKYAKDYNMKQLFEDY
jgi:hypothetical protein